MFKIGMRKMTGATQGNLSKIFWIFTQTNAEVDNIVGNKNDYHNEIEL